MSVLAQGLLNLDLDPTKPFAILSDDSLDHLALSLAAMHIGRVSCTDARAPRDRH